MKKPELKFAIDAAAGVFCDGIVGEAVGGEALAAAHDVNEGPPLAVVHGKARADKEVVLLDALAIEAAAIENDADMRVMGKRKIFKGGIPSAKGVTVGGNDIDPILVGDTDVNVSTGKDLRLRRTYKNQGTQQCQHYGCDF